MEKTRFRLNICGVEVIVSGNVDEAATQQIADTVRSRMQNILNTSYTTSVEKAAVITAMNLCEELEAAKSRAEALEEELQSVREGIKTENVGTAERKIAQPTVQLKKSTLRNPFRPDLGDQTGLVSFFLKEAEEEEKDEEI